MFILKILALGYRGISRPETRPESNYLKTPSLAGSLISELLLIFAIRVNHKNYTKVIKLAVGEMLKDLGDENQVVIFRKGRCRLLINCSPIRCLLVLFPFRKFMWLSSPKKQTFNLIKVTVMILILTGRPSGRNMYNCC